MSRRLAGTVESQSQENVSRVRAEFEKKLGDLQTELRKLEAAKLEHAKMLRAQTQYEKQCRELQRSLAEMKKQKVTTQRVQLAVPCLLILSQCHHLSR